MKRPNLPQKERPKPPRSRLSVYDMTKFALFAGLIFAADLVFDLAMNVEPVTALVMLLTVVYRRRALVPLSLYVTLYLCVFSPSLYNLPYLYVWLVLWGVTMLLPRRMPAPAAVAVYSCVGAVFGLAFGALYLPGWALAAGLRGRSLLLWWEAGLGADLIHAAGNAAFGLLVYPLSRVLGRLESRYAKKTA